MSRKKRDKPLVVKIELNEEAGKGDKDFFAKLIAEIAIERLSKMQLSPKQNEENVG